MDFKESDRCIVFDLLPNRLVQKMFQFSQKIHLIKGGCLISKSRHYEFARASLEMNLEGGCTCPVYYCGIVVDEKFPEIQSILRSMVYKKWDSSTEAPPRSRPQSQENRNTDQLQLQILAFNPGLDKPVWPEVLNNRFDDGPEKKALQEIKAKFEAEFGRALPQTQSSGISRVAGSCDFGFDGRNPLDTSRIIEPEYIPVANVSTDRPLVVERYWTGMFPFSQGDFDAFKTASHPSPKMHLQKTCVDINLSSSHIRLGVTQSKNGKPAVALLKDYTLWLMNPTDQSMEVSAGELCGFGTGSYEESIVRALTVCRLSFLFFPTPFFVSPSWYHVHRVTPGRVECF